MFLSDAAGNLVIETYESGILKKTTTFCEINSSQIRVTENSMNQVSSKVVSISDYVTQNSTRLLSNSNTQRAYDYTGTLFFEPLNLSGTLYPHTLQVYYTYENGDQTSYTINGKEGELVDALIGYLLIGLGLKYTNGFAVVVLLLFSLYLDGDNVVSKNFTEELSADNYYYDVKLVDYENGRTVHEDSSMHIITASGSPHKGEYYYHGMPYYDPSIAVMHCASMWGAQEITELVRWSGDRFPGT